MSSIDIRTDVYGTYGLIFPDIGLPSVRTNVGLNCRLFCTC